MKLLAPDASDGEILALCRDWVDLVAAGRIAKALNLLHVPARYAPSQHWTPASLRKYIENHGSWDPLPDGRRRRVTPIATAVAPEDRPGHRPRTDIYRDRDGSGRGTVELDLPLDGTWSDLTAQFDFGPLDDGVAVALYDLHVL